VKTSRRVWLIWGSASALSLAIVMASSRASSPLIQVLGSAFMFVPILVATAFLKDERKP